MSPADFWAQVRAQLEAAPAGSRVQLLQLDAPSPELAGARRDLGLPAGQLADWRFPPGPDCSGLHVHEHAGWYEAHLDQVHPACSLVGHVQADAPQLLVASGALVGAWLGGGGGVGRLLVGLVLGAAAGAGLTRTRPRD